MARLSVLGNICIMSLKLEMSSAVPQAAPTHEILFLPLEHKNSHLLVTV